MLRRMMLLSVWGVLLLAAAPPSCRSAEQQALQQFDAVTFEPLSDEKCLGIERLKRSVLRVWKSDGVFSAVCLGEFELLAAGHSLRGLEVPTELYVAQVISYPDDVAAGSVMLDQVRVGPEDGERSSDWGYVRTAKPLDALPARINTELHLVSGQEVVLVGYPMAHDGRALHSVSVVRARVSDDRGSVLTLVGPKEWRHPLPGLSGGAAAFWDESLGDYVVFGAFSATRCSEALDDCVYLVVRPPVPFD